MSGRTNFWPKDQAWWGRGRIIKAGREHGPIAPAVLDFIICEAKAQNPVASEEGWVKVGYDAIAWRATFGTSDDVQVRPVVATLVRVGLLDDFDDHGDAFTCRISGWREDVFLPLEAARKARARNAKSGGSGSSKPNPEEDAGSGTSGDVQERPDKSSKGTQPTGTSSLRSDDAPAGEGGEGHGLRLVPGGADGDSLPKIRHGRKPVPAARHRLALDILASFNEQMGTNHGAYKGTGGPSPSLSRILTFLADASHPIDLAVAQAMIANAKRDPYWLPARPTAGNVFSGQSGEKNLEAATAASTAGPSRFAKYDEAPNRSAS